MAAATDYNPPPKRRKSRVPWRSLLVLLLIAVGVGVYKGMTPEETASPQVATPVVATAPGITPVTIPAATTNVPFAVQTEAFSFTLPATPTIEPMDEVVLGQNMVGTGWTVDAGDVYLSVVAINVGSAVNETEVQGAFNSSTAGVIQRSNGTVVSDTWSTTNGLYERTTISTFNGGYIFQRGHANGYWMIIVLGVGPTADPPSWFTDADASFSFV